MKNPTYNDLNLKNWRDYPDILTDSLWLFPGRAKGDGHALDYHGGYIPQIATQLLTRFTKKNEIILDMFLGSGTTALEAVRLQRRCLGVELKPDLVDHVQAKLPSGNRTHLLCGNSADPAILPQLSQALHQ